MSLQETATHYGSDVKTYLGYATAGLAAGTLAFRTFNKVPENHVAMRVHNGSITRPRDSYVVPEWKKGTLYGRYNPGRPRGLLVLLQHLEMISLMDEVSTVSVPIESKANIPEERRRYDVTAAVTWGVPREYKADGTKRDFGVTYDTVLVRAAATAGEKINDRNALRSRVQPVFRAGLREIIQDYEDPRTATRGEVHEALVGLKSEYLMDTLGIEIRDTALEETVSNAGQLQKDGLRSQTITFRSDEGLQAEIGPGGRLILLNGEQDDSA